MAGARVVPILNGLGSVKYEELFVVYRGIDRRLRAAGAEVVDPEVGEFCTSFDMAGCSLTLLWLGNESGGELERLWTAPADTPAFRRGSVAERERADVGTAEAAQRTIPPASAESRKAATLIATLLARAAEAIGEQADELGRMDAVAGDGDHGIGMQRGSRAGAAAARAAVQAGAGAGTTLAEAGDAWSDQGGGTSGVIWGRMLHTLGQAFGDDARVDAGAVPARCLAARHDRRRAGRPGHRATGGPAGAGPVARRQEHRHPRPRRGVLRPRVRDGGRGTGPRGDRLILALRERAVVECGPAMVSCSSSTTPRATRQRLAPLVARRPPAARPVHTPRSGRTCPSVNLTRLVRLTLRGRCRPGGRGWNLAVGGGGCR